MVDKKNFFGRLSIDHNSVGANERLYSYIDTYGKEWGVLMFGSENYDYIVEHIEEERYSFLKELLEQDVNPQACYIFCQYQQDSVSYANASGDVRSTTTNTRHTDNTLRIYTAWNDMVRGNRAIYSWLKSNKETLKDDLDYCNIRVPRLMVTFKNNFDI